MSKRVIVIGAGGHAKVLIDLLNQLSYEIIGVTSLSNKKGETHFGVPVLGDDAVIESHSPSDTALVNGIGSVPGSRQSIRWRVFEKFMQQNYRFPSLVHPSAIIADSVTLSQGVQVMAGVVIQPDVSIAENTIINTRASIDHDCNLGKHSHIAPGVILCGEVNMGDRVHVGCGSVLTQEINVGSDVVIAAGSTLYRSVEANHVVVSAGNRQTVREISYA